jgi:hypothetical protein
LCFLGGVFPENGPVWLSSLDASALTFETRPRRFLRINAAGVPAVVPNSGVTRP